MTHKKQNPNPPAASAAIRAALRDFSDADALRLLFAEVAEYGKTHYKAERQETTGRPELIGVALAQVFRAQEVAEMTYSAWEEMNAHDANRWLAWYWPQVAGEYKNDRDLMTLKRTIAEAEFRGLDISEYDESGNVVKNRYAVTVTATKREVEK